MNTEIANEIAYRAVQCLQILGNVQAKSIQRHYRTDCQLSGSVENTAAAAIDPADRPAAQVKFLGFEPNVASAAAPSDRDE